MDTKGGGRRAEKGRVDKVDRKIQVGIRELDEVLEVSKVREQMII